MRLLSVLAALLPVVCSYNILCLFPLPTRSHLQLTWGIVDALLKGGHQVTWVTPYPNMKNNTPDTLKIIDVSGAQEFINDNDMSNPRNAGSNTWSLTQQIFVNVTLLTLSTPELRDAIINTQFDAVFTEAYSSEVMAGVAAIQQVPWLLFSSVSLSPILEAKMDEVRSISIVPLMVNTGNIPMSFKNRLINTVYYVAMIVIGRLHRTSNDNLYKSLFEPLAKARGVPLPAFNEAVDNVSILFVNAHESITPVFSTPPNVINIAGYHIDENVPALPKDLQKLLDESPQGVVYFSMGSILHSSALPVHTQQALLQRFGTLNQTVLWKFEEKIERLPPNVYVRSWMPQPSILAHPNVRVFITHGGFLSTLEAITFRVPLLAVPVFGDQPANAERAVTAGYARKVTYSEDMADELIDNLKIMLNNNTYYNKMQEVSKLFRNRPVSPAKLIPYYTELAIETKGAFHLRSLSKKYAWYERWMLDQLAFILVVLGVVVELILIAVRRCAYMVGETRANTEKVTKQKQT